MKKAAIVFGLTLSLAVIGFGQARSVTNATLNKYQQKRLAAERDYRENYTRMGFPSPEELDRQRESDMTARLELADQLRRARLDKERLELERDQLAFESTRFDSEQEAVEYDGGFYGGYFGGVGGLYSGDRFNRYRRHSRFGSYYNRLPSYRVTPFGVIQVPNSRPTRAIIRRGGPIRGPRR